MKKLHVKNEDNFRREIEALERLSPKLKQNCPDHLVHLELAYRHGDECCLVFPWAGGNLKEYWKSHARNPNNHKDVIWFFKQCWGLALGLRRLHNPPSYATANDEDVEAAEDILAGAQDAKYGRHGDLKPENILWFDNYHGDQDHLAICDFGSTKFNSMYSKSLVDANEVSGYTETYQPPDNQFEPVVSQKFDVWSLGCVLLEFVSWFLLDYEKTVEVFPRERMMAIPGYPSHIITEDRFFCFDVSDSEGRGNSAMVKPAVIDVSIAPSTYHLASLLPRWLLIM